jgi:hypothetical protein
LQIKRIDSGGVDEEVGAVIFAHFTSEFDNVGDDLWLRVTPGEVSVALLEPDFCELLHHLRTRKCFREKDHFAINRSYFADEPFPEGNGLGMRVIDAKDFDTLIKPKQYDFPRCIPNSRECIAVEPNVDDVLIFFRRIFRKFDGPVLPSLEPLGMFFDPRVVK